jgi:glycosyltransferase involved in cell wall biosynthesis
MQPWMLDHIVAMSQGSAQQVVSSMWVAPRRVSVIPNPASMYAYDAPPCVAPEGKFILGLGRLVRQKRWEHLIDAFARLDRADVRLVIMGEGPMRTALAERVERLGLQGRVELPGYAANPTPAIAAASVLALTSDFEGVPSVLREALAQGTPVVATDCSVAIREIVSSPNLGAIVPCGDVDAIVGSLQDWLSGDRAAIVPVNLPGEDSALKYLELFARLLSAAEERRNAKFRWPGLSRARLAHDRALAPEDAA